MMGGAVDPETAALETAESGCGRMPQPQMERQDSLLFHPSFFLECTTVVDLLRAVSRTVAAIATDLSDPGIMDRFRMPPINNDLLLTTAGDAFADALVDLNPATGFTDHGYEGDIVADLRAEAQDVRDAEGDQGGAPSTQAGATACLLGLLKQGRALVQYLDAVIKNRFRNHAELLAQWKIASHATTDGNGDEPSPPAPPPGGG